MNDELPEHWKPLQKKKEHKITTLSHKQNKPIKKTETRKVDKT